MMIAIIHCRQGYHFVLISYTAYFQEQGLRKREVLIPMKRAYF